MTRTRDEIADLEKFSKRIRAKVLEMSHRAKSSHIGSSFSVADMLAVLYGKVLRFNPAETNAPYRDRFILSKGHACAAMYVALAEKGFFPKDWLDTYPDEGSPLPKHITHTVPGVEASTGSLGHGLAIACGMALAGKRGGESYRVFAMLSDGECEEGSTWEAGLFAAHHCLDNLVAIVDYNKLQAFGRVKDVVNLDPLGAKWQAFGWVVREIDGHNFEQILGALLDVPFSPGQPSCVIAHTVKGKGVSFMEDQLAWHYNCPDDKQLEQALQELGVVFPVPHISGGGINEQSR
ncbi:MAG: transketolase [Chloroflexi bacterium]|nr:transketolase [Chloroflexota bacterium]